MSSSGAEQLAPVTWLFGGQPPSADQQSAPEEPVSAPVEPLQAKAERPSRAARGGFDPISNASMSALARRGMSADEMANYLRGREFDVEEVELECERLLNVGLLDDLALAETLVRTLRERKGLGRSALTAELRRRRIDSGVVEEALAQLDSGNDELQRATALAERRAPQLRSLDQTTAKRRLSAFLMRKGYSGSVVSAAVASALAPSGGPVFR
ncbi:MAG: regulatory protein RecX [Rhodoglobus sp.]|nr:regulatory protein RecX [Rhodoglobus sp.]